MKKLGLVMATLVVAGLPAVAGVAGAAEEANTAGKSLIEELREAPKLEDLTCAKLSGESQGAQGILLAQVGAYIAGARDLPLKGADVGKMLIEVAQACDKNYNSKLSDIASGIIAAGKEKEEATAPASMTSETMATPEE